MANIGESSEDWRGNSIRVPEGNVLRPIKDIYQRNLAILRLRNEKKQSYKDIAHKLCINISTVKNVIFHAKNDKEIPGNYKSSKKITEEQLIDIKLEVGKRCAENNAMPDHEVDESFNKTAMENGKLDPGKRLDAQTLQNLREYCGMTKRKAKAKVDSRIIAEGDIRNYISAAAACQAVLDGVPPHLILNWDETSTTFDEEDHLTWHHLTQSPSFGCFTR